MDDNPYQAPQSRLEADRDEAPDGGHETAERLPHHEVDPTGVKFGHASRHSGLRIDALRFVFDAHVNAADIAQDTPQGRLLGLTLSEAVVRYAEEIYGNEALRALADWDLVTGSDVKRVWIALVNDGLFNADIDHVSDADFAVGPLAQFVNYPRSRLGPT
jgi:hypothetical protein